MAADQLLKTLAEGCKKLKSRIKHHEVMMHAIHQNKDWSKEKIRSEKCRRVHLNAPLASVLRDAFRYLEHNFLSLTRAGKELPPIPTPTDIPWGAENHTYAYKKLDLLEKQIEEVVKDVVQEVAQDVAQDVAQANAAGVE